MHVAALPPDGEADMDGAMSPAVFWQWQEGIEQKWPEKHLSPVTGS